MSYAITIKCYMSMSVSLFLYLFKKALKLILEALLETQITLKF